MRFAMWCCGVNPIDPSPRLYEASQLCGEGALFLRKHPGHRGAEAAPADWSRPLPMDKHSHSVLRRLLDMMRCGRCASVISSAYTESHIGSETVLTKT